MQIESNNYWEGGKAVKIVSTSQLEGFHSALKKLTAQSICVEVGTRILDMSNMID